MSPGRTKTISLSSVPQFSPRLLRNALAKFRFQCQIIYLYVLIRGLLQVNYTLEKKNGIWDYWMNLLLNAVELMTQSMCKGIYTDVSVLN